MRKFRIVMSVLAVTLLFSLQIPAQAVSSGSEEAGTGENALSLTENELAELGAFSQQVCRICMGNSWSQDSIYADDLTSDQQAWLLYWYQYNITDDRISLSASYEWNTATRDDLLSILEEMFADTLEPDALQVFLDEYADHEVNGIVFMSATGDFGDAGPYYFNPPFEYRVEGDLIAVSGQVMGWNQNMECYVNQDMYTGYFTKNPASSDAKAAFCLDHVTIGF